IEDGMAKYTYPFEMSEISSDVNDVKMTCVKLLSYKDEHLAMAGFCPPISIDFPSLNYKFEFRLRDNPLHCPGEFSVIFGEMNYFRGTSVRCEIGRIVNEFGVRLDSFGVEKLECNPLSSSTGSYEVSSTSNPATRTCPAPKPIASSEFPEPWAKERDIGEGSVGGKHLGCVICCLSTFEIFAFSSS
ncbi:hypothetical protein PMAYCL1PPCAC_25638, partial [Pristionchus mayeri]